MNILICTDDDQNLMTTIDGDTSKLYDFNDWTDVVAAYPDATIKNDSGIVIQA